MRRVQEVEFESDQNMDELQTFSEWNFSLRKSIKLPRNKGGYKTKLIKKSNFDVMKKMSYLHFPGIKSFCISFNDLKSRRYT